MVLSVDADIVVLLEATEPLQNFLTADVSKYPYSVGQSLDTGAGFLLYSKYPLCETVVHPNGVSNIETITTTVQSNAGEFSLVAAHPVRPGLRHGNRLNEQELSTIGTIVQSLQGDVVVIGDLNTTMWSDGYKKFVTETKLRNLRQGIGVMPTYGFMFKPIFSIPIDHCLVLGNVNGVSFNSMSLDGSDHEAIIANLAMDANGKE
jgi:endonuclease/exonuclease/phosphatase (EEP) superfamily protein YafD